MVDDYTFSKGLENFVYRSNCIFDPKEVVAVVQENLNEHVIKIIMKNESTIEIRPFKDNTDSRDSMSDWYTVLIEEIDMKCKGKEI